MLFRSLGKISSYVNQNTAEPTPDESTPQVNTQSPTRPQAPQGEKVAAQSEAKLREHIRNLILSELTDAEKEHQKTELENKVADLQGQVSKMTADLAKKKEPLQNQIAKLQKEKEKISKMATK